MGCGSSSITKSASKPNHVLPLQAGEHKHTPFLDKLNEFDSGVTCLDNNSTVDIEDYGIDKITIIHFNDVYNIESREQEPVGGAARFVTKVKEASAENPLILFSGDCLNPSLSKCLFCYYDPTDSNYRLF